MNLAKKLYQKTSKQSARGRNRKYNIILVSLLGAALLLGGCGTEKGRGETESGNVQGTESESAQAAQSEEPARTEVSQRVETSQGSEASQETEPAAASVVFEGQDMEGNVITSDIFGQSRLTMVNVWATYCNPCLSEMPGLGELAGEYDTEDFQLIGIISDVLEGAGEEAMEEARGLIEMTGADYPHLLLNRSLYDALLTDVTGVPTTFFFDQDGNLLGAVVGAAKKEVWKERIDGLLEAL